MMIFYNLLQYDASHFSGDDGTDVGVDKGTTFTNAYQQAKNYFNGKIEKVTVEVKQ